MSTIEAINNNSTNQVAIELLKEMSEIRKNMLQITEFKSNRELKGLSILCGNPFMKRFFVHDDFVEFRCLLTDMLRKQSRLTKPDIEVIKEIRTMLVLIKENDIDMSYITNKKHIKRKFGKDLLQMDKNRSECIAKNMDNENERNHWFQFNRDKRQ